MITIYSSEGEVRFQTEISEGSVRVYTLMTEDYVKLKFSTATLVPFKVGDTVNIDLNDYGATQFILCEHYVPAYNQTTGGYDYEIRFDAYYWKWKNRIFKYSPATGNAESSWSLTNSAEIHLNVFLENLSNISGWDTAPNGEKYTYNIDSAYNGKSIALTYSNTNLIDALTMIAEAVGGEWWIFRNVIRIGKCEHGRYTEVDGELSVEQNDDILGIEKLNAQSFTSTQNTNEYINRLYAFGSTRNIVPGKYRGTLKFTFASSTWSGQTTRKYSYDGDKPLKLSYFRNSLRGGDDFVWYERPVEVVTTDDEMFYASIETVISPSDEGASELFYGTGSSVVYGYEIDLSAISISTSSTLNVTIEIGGGYPVSSTYHYAVNKEMKLPTVLYVLKNTSTPTSLFTVNVYAYSGKEFTMSGSAIRIKPMKYARTSIVKDGVESSVTVVYNGNTSSAVILGEYSGEITINGLITGRVPTAYFTKEVDAGTTALSVYQQNLMLPEGVDYIQLDETLTEDEIVEGVVVYEDIFPTVSGTVKEATSDSEEKESSDGETYTETTWSIFTPDLKEFSANDYIIDEMHIVFSNNLLNGMDFGVKVGDSDASGTWLTIISHDDYGGVVLPNSQLYPQEGDVFSIYGVDTSAIADYCVENAEQALLEQATSDLEELSKDSKNYNLSLMSDYAYKRGCLSMGEQMSLYSPVYFSSDASYIRQSRVIGYEIKIDYPYDTPIYTFGEAAKYSRLGALEKEIEALRKTGESKRSVGGSSSGEYLSSTEKDTAYGLITFAKGVRFGNLLLNDDGSGNLCLTKEDGTSASFYATGSVSALGMGEDGSITAGGILDEVLGSESLGGTFDDADFTKTFNAYAINKVYEATQTNEAAIAGVKEQLDNLEIENSTRNDDKTYFHEQGTAASTWVIKHNLGKYPSVTVMDSAKTIVYGDVTYDSLNQVTLTFSAEFSGYATLN